MGFITSFSQDKEIPDTTVLQRVSIDTATNHVIIEWDPCRSTDIKYYRIYKRFQIGDSFAGDLIDSVLANEYQYEHVTDEIHQKSVAYSVAAVDSANNRGPISEYHWTIYTTVKYDSCNNQMIITASPYTGWENVSKYEIYCKKNNDPYINVKESTETSGVTHSGILENSDYYYFVKAVWQDKESFSNIVHKYTYMPSQPAYINADYATVSENSLIRLSFTYDETAESKDFHLRRFKGMETPSFLIRKRFYGVTSNPLTFTDTVFTTSENYSYQLVSVDACLNAVTLSNKAGNMVLNATNDNLDITLAWTPYQEWQAGVDQYYIYRIINETQVEILDSLDDGKTTCKDDLRPLVNKQISGNICYLVEAREKDGNIYGVKGTSRSNMNCIIITPEVYMPNAFTPNNDGYNDEIGPIVTFIPEDFLFIIVDRWGRKVFESTNPEDKWDGTINGNKANAGVYSYFLKVVTAGNVKIEKRGHITLFYP